MIIDVKPQDVQTRRYIEVYKYSIELNELFMIEDYHFLCEEDNRETGIREEHLYHGQLAYPWKALIGIEYYYAGNHKLWIVDTKFQGGHCIFSYFKRHAAAAEHRDKILNWYKSISQTSHNSVADPI